MPETSSPLLAIYCWTGDVSGEYWFSGEKGNFDYRNPEKVGTNTATVKKYYDNIAINYEHVMRSWGYYMPEMVIDSLIEYGSLTPEKKCSMIDLGCGDGLCGYIAEVSNSYLLHK